MCFTMYITMQQKQLYICVHYSIGWPYKIEKFNRIMHIININVNVNNTNEYK